MIYKDVFFIADRFSILFTDFYRIQTTFAMNEIFAMYMKTETFILPNVP